MVNRGGRSPKRREGAGEGLETRDVGRRGETEMVVVMVEATQFSDRSITITRSEVTT